MAFNQGVYDFVTAYIGDPQTIIDAMERLNVNVEQLADAIDFPVQNVLNYFNAHNLVAPGMEQTDTAESERIAEELEREQTRGAERTLTPNSQEQEQISLNSLNTTVQANSQQQQLPYPREDYVTAALGLLKSGKITQDIVDYAVNELKIKPDIAQSILADANKQYESERQAAGIVTLDLGINKDESNAANKNGIISVLKSTGDSMVGKYLDSGLLTELQKAINPQVESQENALVVTNPSAFSQTGDGLYQVAVNQYDVGNKGTVVHQVVTVDKSGKIVDVDLNSYQRSKGPIQEFLTSPAFGLMITPFLGPLANYLGSTFSLSPTMAQAAAKAVVNSSQAIAAGADPMTILTTNAIQFGVPQLSQMVGVDPAIGKIATNMLMAAQDPENFLTKFATMTVQDVASQQLSGILQEGGYVTNPAAASQVANLMTQTALSQGKNIEALMNNPSALINFVQANKDLLSGSLNTVIQESAVKSMTPQDRAAFLEANQEYARDLTPLEFFQKTGMTISQYNDMLAANTEPQAAQIIKSQLPATSNDISVNEQYNDANRGVIVYNGTRYQFDANGNMLSQGYYDKTGKFVDTSADTPVTRGELIDRMLSDARIDPTTGKPYSQIATTLIKSDFVQGKSQIDVDTAKSLSFSQREARWFTNNPGKTIQDYQAFLYRWAANPDVSVQELNSQAAYVPKAGALYQTSFGNVAGTVGGTLLQALGELSSAGGAIQRQLTGTENNLALEIGRKLQQTGESFTPQQLLDSSNELLARFSNAKNKEELAGAVWDAVTKNPGALAYLVGIEAVQEIPVILASGGTGALLTKLGPALAKYSSFASGATDVLLNVAESSGLQLDQAYNNAKAKNPSATHEQLLEMIKPSGAIAAGVTLATSFLPGGKGKLFNNIAYKTIAGGGEEFVEEYSIEGLDQAVSLAKQISAEKGITFAQAVAEISRDQADAIMLGAAQKGTAGALIGGKTTAALTLANSISDKLMSHASGAQAPTVQVSIITPTGLNANQKSVLDQISRSQIGTVQSINPADFTALIVTPSGKTEVIQLDQNDNVQVGEVISLSGDEVTNISQQSKGTTTQGAYVYSVDPTTKTALVIGKDGKPSVVDIGNQQVTTGSTVSTDTGAITQVIPAASVSGSTAPSSGATGVKSTATVPSYTTQQLINAAVNAINTGSVKSVDEIRTIAQGLNLSSGQMNDVITASTVAMENKNAANQAASLAASRANSSMSGNTGSNVVTNAPNAGSNATTGTATDMTSNMAANAASNAAMQNSVNAAIAAANAGTGTVIKPGSGTNTGTVLSVDPNAKVAVVSDANNNISIVSTMGANVSNGSNVTFDTTSNTLTSVNSNNDLTLDVRTNVVPPELPKTGGQEVLDGTLVLPEIKFTDGERTILDEIIGAPVEQITAEETKPTEQIKDQVKTTSASKSSAPKAASPFGLFPFLPISSGGNESVDYDQPDVPPPELYGIFNLPPPEYTQATGPMANVGIMSGATQ